MAMGRNIRVSGRYKRDQDYSLLVEMRGQEQSLLVFPNNRVQTINGQELGDLRGEYDHLCDGYALLGNLTVPLDGGQLHFLVLATQCTSVGKINKIFLATYHVYVGPFISFRKVTLVRDLQNWFSEMHQSAGSEPGLGAQPRD